MSGSDLSVSALLLGIKYQDFLTSPHRSNPEVLKFGSLLYAILSLGPQYPVQSRVPMPKLQIPSGT